MQELQLFVQAEHFGMAVSHFILLFRHFSHAGILIDEDLGIIACEIQRSVQNHRPAHLVCDNKSLNQTG